MRVIYDCDNTLGLPFREVDDGLTLLYLLGRPDIELLGVATTFGNGTAEQAYQQTKKLLQQAGREEIPVFLGADRRYAGPTQAARFLAGSAAAHPGEISLLATGPLGNLRGAAEVDPGFFGNLKQIACMGGYLAPLRIGRKQVAELNLSADPEASYQVLNAACPVTLMNAQTCLQAGFNRQDIARLKFWPRKIRRNLTQWLLAFGLVCGVREFYLWDLLPAVYLSHPELFTSEKVDVISTIKDLETGKLVFSEDSAVKRVTMPSRITNIVAFRTALFEAWKGIDLN
jgi:inosine-uridine nucleoside N-ribohydrolase